MAKFSNTTIWALVGVVFLFNSKWSPLRNVFKCLSSRRLHPTVLSRFLGNVLPSFMLLDDKNAYHFSLPAIFTVLLYFIINLLVILFSIPKDGAAVATGKAAVMNMWIALLPTAKSSLLLYITGVPFERAIKFHKIVTLVGFSLCTAHLILARTEIVDADDDGSTGSSNIFIFNVWSDSEVRPGWGLLAYIGYCLMFATAFEFVRKSKYELFLYVHYIWILAIVFNMLHFEAGSKNQLWFLPGLFLHLCDKVYIMVSPARTAVVNNISATAEKSSGAQVANVVSMKVIMQTNHSSMYYMSFWKRVSALLSCTDPKAYADGGDWEYDSFHGGLGQYYFVNVPKISMLEWHPFSVSEVIEGAGGMDVPGAVTFHVKSMGTDTFTGRLANLAQSGSCEVPVHLRGPYGCLNLNLADYAHVLIFAGGIGITPMLPILDRIRLVCSTNKTRKLPHLKSVTIVWVAKQSKEDQALFQYFADRITKVPDTSSAAAASDVSINESGYQMPTLKTSLVSQDESAKRVSSSIMSWDAQFYCTGAATSAVTGFTTTAGAAHTCHLGRPNFTSIIENTQKGSVTERKSIGAVICGPAEMSSDAAKSCADVGVDYHVETFGW